MLRRKTIVDRNDDATDHFAQRTAELIFRVEVGQHKAAPMKENQNWKRCRALWHINPDWDFAPGAGNDAIHDEGYDRRSLAGRRHSPQALARFLNRQRVEGFAEHEIPDQ